MGEGKKQRQEQDIRYAAYAYPLFPKDYIRLSLFFVKHTQKDKFRAKT